VAARNGERSGIRRYLAVIDRQHDGVHDAENSHKVHRPTRINYHVIDFTS